MATKILLSKDKKQYKANLHSHSNLSDGKLSPAEMKELYKANGYDILAITDHCRPMDHSAMNEEDFLLLTGYEAYIRGENHSAYCPEVHLNLFAKDPKNVTLICYNEKYTKYIPKEQHGDMVRAGSERPREYTSEYINEFIETANANGYLVSYNHPFWSMESEEQILSYKNYFSLEMYNTSSYVTNNIEGAEALYDRMLRLGMHVGCHAGDDNHNKHPFDDPENDSCGWYTMILSDSLEYGNVIDALEKKECYASSGPRINEISVIDGETVHLECSPVSKAFMFVGSKAPKRVLLPKGETGTSFDFKLHEKAQFIRITVYDEDGNVANSRGFFPEEWMD